ncbi:MAG: hypothetical protein B0W54_20380 [Cellvibrio sp. 79]|nr:MAG: hypothetical protein B0W54_20380 [Cellvibrio sp. 79]
MNARKSVHMLVIALCLWLPLQAIAGQWQHCAQMQSLLSNLDQNNNQSIEQEIPPCHQIADTTIQTSADQPQQDLQDSDIKSCKHCQFVCHWHCVLLKGDLVSGLIDLTPYYIPFKNPSPAQPLLSQPQKPPQAFAA